MGVVLAISARAQSPLDPGLVQQANLLFENGTKGDHLGCTIHQKKPFLDFAFRFETGYSVQCSLAEFEGRSTTMAILARVTPERGAPVLLEGFHRVPAAPPETHSRWAARKSGSRVEGSGSFSIGEGRYLAEVMVRDNRGRMAVGRWRIKATRNRQERTAPIAQPPMTVVPLVLRPWDGKLLAERSGYRLTVLLNAAPLDPRSFKLRVEDRVFLLAALTSLLQQVPCQSVRLVAFNLDQQREVFRQERFDGSGFTGLSEALRKLDLATISSVVLRNNWGWAQMLAGLVDREVMAEDPSDAVVFLGPATRYWQHVPPKMLCSSQARKPLFFCFEYFPFRQGKGEFPDAIDRFTKAREGLVLRIHSPGEFAQGIQKLLLRLKPADDATADMNSSAAPGSGE